MRYFSAFAPLFVYAYFRFFARPQLLSLFGPHGDYWFETGFCVLALLLFYSKIKIKFEFSLLKKFGISLGLGTITLVIAKLLGILIPFQIDTPFSILMFVLLGPILEELLFRFSLYWPFESILPEKITAFLTATFFSYCHFNAYFVVPDTIKVFVLYQTFYTFLIGLWWIKIYQKDQNIVSPIGLHIFYNLGFYLGILLF